MWGRCRLLLCFWAAFGHAQVFAEDLQLKPTESVVDYLKTNKRPSAQSDRAGYFKKFFPDEKYSGTAEQNQRLLVRLVAEAQEAAKFADKGKIEAALAASQAVPAETKIEQSHACPGWVPAEGFGFLGSYGFTVRASSQNGQIHDRNFVVTVSAPGAAQKGPLNATGKAVISVDGKEVQTVELQPAWFPAIGPAGDKTFYLYAKMGTTITVPKGKSVTASVSLNVTSSTAKGLVALWPCSTTVILNDK